MLAFVSCVNPNRMFTGRWISVSPIEITGFSGNVEIGIGHYGPDLVGVARFYDSLGRPYAPCACSIIESRGVRIGEGAFTAVSDNCGESIWLWNLMIDLDSTPALLNGTIAADAGAELIVAFEQTDGFVEESFKACDP